MQVLEFGVVCRGIGRQGLRNFVDFRVWGLAVWGVGVVEGIL